MTFASAPISFGYVGQEPVFMDLDADLYFALEPAEAELLIGEAGPPAQAPPVAASIFDDPGEQAAVRWRDLLSVLAQVIRTRRVLRRCPIADAAACPAGTASGRISVGHYTARSLALRFARARKLVPMAPHCLLDSLALTAWLGRRGIASTLVFGVKLDPFAAHCWVQSGPLLLTDRCEEIERFVPVRVVECVPVTP